MSLLVARRGILAAGAAPAPAPAPSGDYATEVAADSPDWWLRLEETSGATASDEVGTNDGTVTGANLNVASFADTGSAASFDGIDDKIEVPNDALLNAGDTFTFECVVKLNDPDADALQVIADKTRVSSSNNQWSVAWDNRSSLQRLRFLCGPDGNQDHARADWEGDIPRDALAAGVHLVCTFDRTADISCRIYAGGYEVARSASGTTSALSSNTRALGIGFRPGDDDFHLGGIVDEPAIYPVVLAEARIIVHAGAALDIFDPETYDPLAAILWDQVSWADDPGWTDPGDGNTVEQWDDASGNGRHFTQSNASHRPIFRTAEAAMNDQPTLEGTSSARMEAALSAHSQPYTMVAVVRGPGGTAAFVDGTTTATRASLQIASGDWVMFAGSSVGGGSTDTDPHLLVAHFDGAASTLTLDGEELLSGNAGSNGVDVLRIMANVTPGSFLNGGHIALFGFKDGALSEDDKLDLWRWARHTYDIF